MNAQTYGSWRAAVDAALLRYSFDNVKCRVRCNPMGGWAVFWD